MSFLDLARASRCARCAAIACAPALSLLGVAIGVAAVVTLTALGEGARRYVLGQFAAVGTNMVIVLPGQDRDHGRHARHSAACPHDLTLDDALAVARGVREVDKLAPMVVGTETVAFGERRRQVALFGSTHEVLEVRRLRHRAGPLPAPARRGTAAPPVAVLGSNSWRGSSSRPRIPSGRSCASATGACA